MKFKDFFCFSHSKVVILNIYWGLAACQILCKYFTYIIPFYLHHSMRYRYCYKTHFTEEQTETQKCHILFPVGHNHQISNDIIKSKCFWLRTPKCCLINIHRDHTSHHSENNAEYFNIQVIHHLCIIVKQLPKICVDFLKIKLQILFQNHCNWMTQGNSSRKYSNMKSKFNLSHHGRIISMLFDNRK